MANGVIMRQKTIIVSDLTVCHVNFKLKFFVIINVLKQTVLFHNSISTHFLFVQFSKYFRVILFTR